MSIAQLFLSPHSPASTVSFPSLPGEFVIRPEKNLLQASSISILVPYFSEKASPKNVTNLSQGGDCKIRV